MSEPVTYEIAEEAKPIGDALIKEHHRHLLYSDIPLLYVFRSKHTESNCKPVLGKAKRVTGLNAFLAYRHLIEETGDDAPPALLVIELAKDLWNTLKPEQRVALIDHELCHFGHDGMRAHDVEEFREVIERHGLWKPDVEALALTIAQQRLFVDIPPDPQEIAGLTPFHIGTLRSHAERHAMQLMKIALDQKRQPTNDERKRLEQQAMDDLAFTYTVQKVVASRFYNQEIERFMQAKFSEFEAGQG